MFITDRKLRVFLCHAKEDKAIVRDIYRQLTSAGWIDVWLDEVKLLPGEEWDMQIEEAVENADAVIVFLSNNSLTKKGYVQKELNSVLDVAEYNPEGTIFIIPILLEPCQIPRRLKRYQYQEYFTDINQAFYRLTISLEMRANTIGIDIDVLKRKMQTQLEERAKLEREELIRKDVEEKIRKEEEYVLREKAADQVRMVMKGKLLEEAERNLLLEIEENLRQEKDRFVTSRESKKNPESKLLQSDKGSIDNKIGLIRSLGNLFEAIKNFFSDTESTPFAIHLQTGLGVGLVSILPFVFAPSGLFGDLMFWIVTVTFLSGFVSGFITVRRLIKRRSSDRSHNGYWAAMISGLFIFVVTLIIQTIDSSSVFFTNDLSIVPDAKNVLYFSFLCCLNLQFVFAGTFLGGWFGGWFAKQSFFYRR